MGQPLRKPDEIPVRIDYVEHSISAWMQYEKLMKHSPKSNIADARDNLSQAFRLSRPQVGSIAPRPPITRLTVDVRILR